MATRKQKKRQKILDALGEKAPLSTNKGEFIPTSFKFYSKKDRRNSGRKFPNIQNPGMKYSEMISQGLEPKEYWDDWDDYRDGFRDLPYGNRCEICKEKLNTIKKKILLRKAKRYKKIYKGGL